MEATLEYLALGVLIVLLIAVAYGMASTSMNTLGTVYEEQLFTVAERVMDKIVLTPGYPADWGTNISVTPDTLTDFGLALAGTRTPYVVDPDKVMRLANLSTLPNPLLLNASRLAQLLGLSENYGFRLRMRPMLVVSVKPVAYRQFGNWNFSSIFQVNVTNYYGLGIPNANVTGMYVIVRVNPGNGEVEKKQVFAKSNLTGPLGTCTLDYRSELSNYFNKQRTDRWFFAFLILRAEWQGFVSVAGYAPTAQRGVPVEGYIIGKYIFVDRTIEVGKTSGAVHVKDELLQAVPEYQNLLNFTTVVWCRDSTGNFRNDDPLCNNAGKVLPSAKQWYLVGYVKYVEPLSSHIFVFAQFRGSPVVIVVNRIPSIDISYGGSKAQPANSVTLGPRICTIYSYPYVVELTIWRRVEGFP
ncbi:hypothetical protein [Thermofilum pendens]|uniref:Uncharacterized protein n=1 Tax=Thermofilum pendens (strain DSM 2475 / Hrk 5) TaxID=368408 RepID=A1RYP0_THEPD|nr:hypothetical protein [Thermofilum pendens]ABL78320.1 hypothetical protein Tpen_0919 [Thermofilum pendens Hrk 5]